MTLDPHNPLDDLLSFPESVVHQREDVMPSESSGWGIHILISLPRSVTQANLVIQLEMAGFQRESDTGQRGLVRFIRDDAYVWGMVSDGPSGLTSVLLSLTEARPDEETFP